MISHVLKKPDELQSRQASIHRPTGFYPGYGKRVVDIAGALLLLLVFAPLILLLVLGLQWQRGPLFFGHPRIGRGGRVFTCLKFRTMVPDADSRLAQLLDADPQARAEWESSRKLAHDPRITPVGRFLRRTSLDELPQLLNVLRGEMSLVGPRPVTQSELEMYGQARDAYLSLRPGLTGQWQVSGRNGISYAARVSLDEAYARNPSLPGDLVILMRTALVVLGATGK